MPENTEQLKQKIKLLEHQLRRKEIEMQSIQHIGKTLSSELRTDHLLILIMNEVTRLMNAERSSFYVVDEERGELWTKIAQKAEITEIRLKIGMGIAGNVAKTGEIINIPDAYNDPRFDPSTDKRTGYHTQSILCMPIFEPTIQKKSKPAIIGVVQVLNKVNGIFTDSDEELLSSIASQVAISIINSRLYSALEKKISEINLLFEIEKELNKTYDLDELLQLLLDNITDAIKVEAAVISLKDKEKEDIVHRVAKNLDLEKLGNHFLSHNSGIAGKVCESGEIFVANDRSKDKELTSDLDDQLGLKIRQMVCAPLKINSEVIGIIELFNKSEQNDFFRKSDIQLINSLSSQISRSIEAYRLRDEKIKAERLASIGNMMSTIVHDLRTPMNNIYGFVDLMQEEEDQATRAEFAEIIINQIKTLTNMTTDILDFSKGKTSILPVKHPVDKLLSNFAKFFEQDVRARGYDFEIVCNVQSMLYIDPEKISRVFMNIMKNALESMDKGGKFSIIADQLGDEVVFKLSDTGNGIPDEIRDSLFDSFVTSGKEGGTGLGLAIVKNMVDQHKGRIEVESQPGQGTTFKLFFKKI